MDFNIQRTVREVTDVDGRKVNVNFTPAAGNTIAVVYIEASGNLGAINTKLGEIEALADNYADKVWPVVALQDKTARVDVRVIVRDDIEVS